jgi:hypothetical protein
LALEAVINECPEDDPDARASPVEYFLEIVRDTKVKLDSFSALVVELEARHDARKIESDRLAARAKRDQDQADYLRARLKDYFNRHHLKTVETARYRLTLTPNRGCVPVMISAVDDLPRAFVRTVTKTQPDVESIRKALESGKPVAGATLGERGTSVRIR